MLIFNFKKFTSAFLFQSIIILFILSSCSKEVSKKEQTNTKNTYGNIEVFITGVSKKLKQEIEKVIAILKYKNKALESKYKLALLLELSQKEIKEVLINYGYYKPIVSIKPVQIKNSWNIYIDINKGPIIIVSKKNIKINGMAKNELAFQKLLTNFPIKINKPLNNDLYKKAKSSLTNLAFNQGFFDATLTKHQVIVNEDTNKATLNLTLDSSNRYIINKINIKQKNYKFDEDFIKKFLTIEKNQYFSLDNIVQSIKNLERSGYFNISEITPEIGNRNKELNTLPIDINLVAKYNRTYTAGFGFGTFTGPRILAGVNFKNISKDGQYANIKFTISEINTSLYSEYVFPILNPIKDYISITSKQGLVNYIPYKANNFSFGINLNIGKKNYFNTFSIYEQISKYSMTNSNTKDSVKNLVFSWGFAYNFIEKDGFWDNGLFFSNSLKLSLQNSLSDNSFIRNQTNVKFSFPLYPMWNRIILKSSYGFLQTDNINNVAPNFRFYVGGINSILGWSYLSESPRDSDGVYIGGKYLFTSSLTIEQRLYKELSLLLYYNIGNATNNKVLDFSNFLQSAGFGFSYKTQIGNLEFYFTRTIKHQKSWKFDFNIGVSL